MPRPPKFIHPLRTVRDAMGKKTQAALASLVGVSAVTIKKIEQGDLEMSMPLSMRIMGVTGANPLTVRDPAGKPKDIWGEPYDVASYLAFMNGPVGKAGGSNFDTNEIYKQSLAEMTSQMEWLVQAAAQRQRLPALQFAWISWIFQAASDFDLLESFLKRSSTSHANDVLFAHLKVAAVSSTKAQLQRDKDLALIVKYQRVKEFTPPSAQPSTASSPSSKRTKSPKK